MEVVDPVTIIEVASSRELHNTVDNLVGILPTALSPTLLPSEPYALIEQNCSYKYGIKSIKVKLVKDIYDENQIEYFEVIKRNSIN